MIYRAVLWDWDGTLFDSDRECWRANTKVHVKHGLPTEGYEVYRRRIGNGIVRSVGPIAQNIIDQVRVDFFTEFDSSNCHLIEGVDEVLFEIKRRGLSCGIVSAHGESEIIERMEKFGITHHFRRVVGGMRNKSPALLNVCDEFGVAPKETLFVGDLLSDVLDGNAAGLHTVLYAPDDYPHMQYPTHRIAHLREIIRLLD